MEKFRIARDVLQGQLHFVDHRRTSVVRPATLFRLRALLPNRFHRHLDQVAIRPAHRREQLHPATLPGLFSHQLHQPVRTRAHGQNGFLFAPAREHALPRLPARRGFGRVRECALRRVRHYLRGDAIAPAPEHRPIRGLRRVVRRRDFDSLLADVYLGDDLFLDGARARHCLGLLQSVQHRADAGHGVSGRVQSRVHLCAARVAREQRPDPGADRYFNFGLVLAPAARRGAGVGGNFRMVLALLHPPLHQRQFVK